MARPAPRPRSAAPAESGRPDALAPAPDTGVPFSLVDRPAKTRTHQLGVRVPEDLWQRLAAVSEESGVSITRLVTRAVETEVARLEGQSQ